MQIITEESEILGPGSGLWPEVRFTDEELDSARHIFPAYPDGCPAFRTASGEEREIIKAWTRECYASMESWVRERGITWPEPGSEVRKQLDEIMPDMLAKPGEAPELGEPPAYMTDEKEHLILIATCNLISAIDPTYEDREDVITDLWLGSGRVEIDMSRTWEPKPVPFVERGELYRMYLMWAHDNEVEREKITTRTDFFRRMEEQFGKTTLHGKRGYRVRLKNGRDPRTGRVQ